MFLKVRVKVGSKKEKITKKDEETFLISVKEKAERNEANHRILEIIAGLYNLSVKKVHIIKGHQSSSKLLRVDL